MNQFAHGEKICIPSSVVRSVSFQKIRQGSLSSRDMKQQQISSSHQSNSTNNNHPSSQSSQGQTSSTARIPSLCQRLLQKKLSSAVSNTAGFNSHKSTQPQTNTALLNSNPNINNNPINTAHNVNSFLKQRTELYKKQQQQKQLKQCTFKPKINKTSLPSRTIQQFIDQHNDYQQYKNAKINHLRQEIIEKCDKENTFRPNIVINNNNNTQNNGNYGYSGDAKKSVGQVYQRLYQQSIKRQQSKQNIVPHSIQKRSHASKFGSQPKITTFSRKNSEKSIVQSNKMIINNNDLSQFNSSSIARPTDKTTTIISQSSKNNTQVSEQFQVQSVLTHTNNTNTKNSNVLNGRVNTHGNSVQSRTRSRSGKGIKTVVTKNIDVQVQNICDRKLNMNYQKEKERVHQNQNINSNGHQIQPNSKNRELYIKKILRQIGTILSDLKINNPNLSYSQMTSILQKMNFIEIDSQQHQENELQTSKLHNTGDRKYAQQIWQMLQGDLYQNCPLANLVRIIYCLLGSYQFSMIQQGLAMVMPQSCAAKRLVLSERQARSIRNNFQQLSLNRLRKGQYISNTSKPDIFSFKPAISKNSLQFAQKYRQRMLLQSEQLLSKNLMQYQIDQNKQVGHVDLLMLDQKRKQAKIMIMRQQAQLEKKRVEDQAMQGDQNRDKERKYRNGIDYNNQNNQARFQHLYELGKNTIRQKNQKQNEQSYSSIPIPKQCTFHPNISSSKQHKSNSRVTQKSKSKQNQSHSSSHNQKSTSNFNEKSTSNFDTPVQMIQNNGHQGSGGQQIKDFDRSVFRMYQGRRIRQQSNTQIYHHNQSSRGAHHNYTHASRSITDRSQRSILSDNNNFNNYNSNTGSSQSRSCTTRSRQQQLPFLYLNVCMQGADDIKVPVFHTDNMKTITHKVKILMGLNNAEDQRLQEILRMQILPALEQIGIQ